MKRLLLVFLTVLLMLQGAAGAETAPYTLLPANEIPQQIEGRVLSDVQIAAMADADLPLLQVMISTYADYIAWLEQLPAQYFGITTSNGEGQLTMGGGFSFQWHKQMLSCNMFADMAMSLLAEDYPGMMTIVALYYHNGTNTTPLFANAIPVDGGYVVVSASSYVQKVQASNCGKQILGPVFVETIEDLVRYCQTIDSDHGVDAKLMQILAINTNEMVTLDINETLMYEPSDASLTVMLFADESVRYPDSNSAPKLGDLGVSGLDSASEINDSQSAKAIREAGLEEAAKQINTVQDLMNYLYYSCYVAGDGDRFLPVSGNIEWHYNYKPEVVFERHTGCCGATSGLAAYLLEGDYEEVGFVGITYVNGAGGGHVVNYIKHNGSYYLLDLFSWAMNGYSAHGNFFRGSSVDVCAKAWAKQLWNTPVRAMYAYTNPRYGDAPVGWSTKEWGVSYLFKDYAENVRIIMETPEEGYVYEFVEADPRLVEGIDLIRSVW